MDSSQAIPSTGMRFVKPGARSRTACEERDVRWVGPWSTMLHTAAPVSVAAAVMTSIVLLCGGSSLYEGDDFLANLMLTVNIYTIIGRQRLQDCLSVSAEL